jgi:phosphate uptake regulator
MYDEILVLDSMVENATLSAVEALKKRDVVSAQRIYDEDSNINAKRFELENELIVTIATQQPIMAHDLRLLASIYEVIGELERIAIVHTHVAERVKELRALAGSLLPAADIPVEDITPVIGAHIGPGAAGFAVVTAQG